MGAHLDDVFVSVGLLLHLGQHLLGCCQYPRRHAALHRQAAHALLHVVPGACAQDLVQALNVLGRRASDGVGHSIGHICVVTASRSGSTRPAVAPCGESTPKANGTVASAAWSLR